MIFSNFLNSLNSQLEKVLSEEQFSCTRKGQFIRLKGDVIHLIQIQKHSEEPTCCINLGVHFTFMPLLGTDKLPEIEKIEVPDCEIKIRLTPAESQRDHWWGLNDESIGEICEVIQKRGLLKLNLYELEKLSRFMPADLKAELPIEFISMTRVRAALLLARLNLYIGKVAEATEFANYGLKVAGMAVGPKSAFKAILKQCEDTK